MRFLLDTSTVSAATAAVPNRIVVDRITTQYNECAISATVLHELLFGMERLPEGRRKAELAAFLGEVVEPHLEVLAYDRLAAEWHARERAQQARIGQPTPFADGQIAAVARVNGLTLVTANVRDFDGRFEGLDVEGWSTL